MDGLNSFLNKMMEPRIALKKSRVRYNLPAGTFSGIVKESLEFFFKNDVTFSCMYGTSMLGIIILARTTLSSKRLNELMGNSSSWKSGSEKAKAAPGKSKPKP